MMAEVDLITRFGGGTTDPSLDDLKEALRELGTVKVISI